jgi:uncharacterized lipoprotein
MTIVRWGFLAGAALVCCGCHGWRQHAFSHDCHAAQDYQRAPQVAPLRVPEGLDAPNVQGALVIPAVDAAPPPPGPRDACLDEPPRFKAAAPPKPAAG